MSQVVVILGGFVLLWVVYNYFLFPDQHLAHVPSPPAAHWLFGHELLVFQGDVGKIYDGWFQSLGSIFKMKASLWKEDTLVISDPDAIAHISQKRVFDYHHSKVLRPRIERLLGKSLAWVEGAKEHKIMRMLISPSLSAESVRNSSQDVLEAAINGQDLLNRFVEEQGGEVTINILDWCSRITLDVIGRVGFGHDFQGGTSRDANDILNSWRGQASVAINFRGFLMLSLLRRFPWINHLPISSMQAQSQVKVTINRGVAREMVKRYKETSDGITSKRNDLLSRMMTFHEQGHCTKDELFDHITTMILAGYETTGQLLGLTIWELSRHPDIQQQLREEVLSFPGEPTYDDYQNKLPLLDAVTRESMRLHPSVPYMERVATAPDIVPLRHPIITSSGETINSVSILPGQTVFIPIVSVNRMDSVWGDGHTYRPSRWFKPLPPSELLGQGFSNTLTFSDGPRNCVGMRLALFQYKVILSRLVARFIFKETDAKIRFNVASSIQPWVEGKRHMPSNLPVTVELA